MYKIQYPTLLQDKANFESDYYKSLTFFDEVSINRHLANITLNGAHLTSRELITLSFDYLLVWRNPILHYASKLNVTVGKLTTNAFSDLFNYKSNQPKIAEFFMQQKTLAINTCYYCGIEYINAFKDIGDYKDELDFVNKADGIDLQKIKGLGQKAVEKVLDARKHGNILSLSTSGLNSTQQNNVRGFRFGDTHNHFTLDHILPQKFNKFFSLCLYNLVPSCYSCNSKFKKAQNFNSYNSLERVSPTSSNYTLVKDLTFKLYYSGSLKTIKSESDFVLAITEQNNNPHTAKYLEMFKLKGRYIYHKDKVLHLIKQKNNYSDSRIKELSLKTGLPLKEIKQLVFGKELFSSLSSNESLVKFKRDIAKNIGINDTLD
jgi:hypothetical protein